MKCPKCGFEQSAGRECVRCGVIFLRIWEPPEEGGRLRPATRDDGRGRSSAGWLLLAAVAVMGVGWWWVERPAPEAVPATPPEARAAPVPALGRRLPLVAPRPSTPLPAADPAEGRCPLLDAPLESTARRAVGGGWLETPEYEEAERQQRELGAPLLVYFRTDWCRYCRALERGLLADATVESHLSDAVVRCRVNPEQSAEAQAVANRYGVTGYPALFLAAAGAVPVEVSVYDARSDALASPEGFFRELLESERRLSQELVVAGDRVRRQGDLAGALDLLDRAVALCDTNADAFLFRGIARGALGDSAGAYSDFGRAAELEPTQSVAYAEIERLLAPEGRWLDAAACWDLYLLDDPHDAEALQHRDQCRARAARG